MWKSSDVNRFSDLDESHQIPYQAIGTENNNSLNNSGLSWIDWSPLALPDFIEQLHPSISGSRNSIKLHTINESRRCARDASGCTILPDRPRLHLSVVDVLVVVEIQKLQVVQRELDGHGIGPVQDKVIVRHVSHAQDCVLLIEAVFHVLVHQARFARLAFVEEVWEHLGHLPRVDMVVKWEVANLDGESIHKGDSWCNLGFKSGLDVGIVGLRVRTEEVNEELKLDAGFSTTLDPAWVCAVDWHTVGSGICGQTCSECRFEHLFLCKVDRLE